MNEDRIEVTGRLVREGAGFVLRRDGGGMLWLQLGRTPVDAVEKQVRVTGRLIGDALVEVEGVALM
jgi:hypothetical protein